MEATILTIGDELLIGQIVDANATWLARELNLLGITVRRTITAGDDVAAIQSVLGEAVGASDLVVVTGGLGPTPDDVTTEAVAAFFGRQLVTDALVLEHVRQRFRKRGWSYSPLSERVALVPAGFEILPNAAGTAPGLWTVHEQGERSCTVVLVPGVPREMKTIFHNHIAPRLVQSAQGRLVEHRTLRTVGIGESRLQELMGDLSTFLDDSVRVASLPSVFQVRLRLSAYGTDSGALRRRLDILEEYLRSMIGSYVYGSDDEAIEDVVGRLLLEHGMTLAVAESCTGGGILDRMTNTPGASAYVRGGVVAYANAVKTRVLGVSPEVLATCGAVSREVAIQLATGVQDHLQTDIGLSTTGVAGPSGGTPEKPVGTVWIGYALQGRQGARKYCFGKNRRTNKTRAAIAAIDMLRRELLGLDTEKYYRAEKIF